MSSFDRLNLKTATVLCSALTMFGSACSSSEPPPATSTQPATPPKSAPSGTSAAGTAAPATPSTGGEVKPGAAGTGTPTSTATAGSGAAQTTPAETPAGGGPDVPVDEGTTPVKPSTSEWTMMGYDHGSTYNNIAETKISKESVANLKEAWTADLGGNVLGAALMVGDKIYATAPASVRAFDATSGSELWQTAATSTSSLSYADGKLYLHTRSAQILALNAEDGAKLWEKPLNPDFAGDGSASALVAGDVILVGASNGGIELGGGSFRGHLTAVDVMTGDNKWIAYTVPEATNGASMWSSPSADLEAGVAYGSTGNNYGMPASDTSDSIIQFDLKTGDIKWKAQRVENDTFGPGFGGGPDYDFGANPVLYETMVDGAMTKLVSAGAKSGAAHAVRRDTGELVWTRSMCEGTADGSSGIFTNSAWTGKNMLFACNEGGPATLYALDGATGDIAWMRALKGQVWGRTAIANGVGFVGTGTTLEAFDVDTGAVLKSIESKGGTIASTITVSNGRVAFGEGLSWSGGVAGRTLTVLSVE
jgi:polyvinyl alcohol dehydrogenase (cytochrome)